MPRRRRWPMVATNAALASYFCAKRRSMVDAREIPLFSIFSSPHAPLMPLHRRLMCVYCRNFAGRAPRAQFLCIKRFSPRRAACFFGAISFSISPPPCRWATQHMADGVAQRPTESTMPRERVEKPAHDFSQSPISDGFILSRAARHHMSPRPAFRRAT